VGQKVHPIGFRVGVYRDWDARWYAAGKNYGKSLLEDIKIREFINKNLDSADIARVEIEKAGDSVRVILHSGRPGVVIGKKGQGIEALRSDIGKMLGKNSIEISVQEVKKPEVDAMLIAKSIASKLERRESFKRAMKQASATAMRAGTKGIKIRCAGRLNGAEIARAEAVRVGSLPLHTLRSDIDYGFAEAHTTYGIIGVKVWIFKGDYQHIRQA
jgi:small subunit ribosomal protein S3